MHLCFRGYFSLCLFEKKIKVRSPQRHSQSIKFNPISINKVDYSLVCIKYECFKTKIVIRRCFFRKNFIQLWTTDSYRYCMSGVVMIDVLFRFVWFPRKEYIDHNGVQLFWIFFFYFHESVFSHRYICKMLYA